MEATTKKKVAKKRVTNKAPARALTPIEKAHGIIKYDITEAGIEALHEKYKDVDGKTPYKDLTVGIADVRTVRVSIEKRRKDLKAGSLEWGRSVDATAAAITEKLVAIEEPMKALKRVADEVKEIEKAEKARLEQERVDYAKALISAISSKPLEVIGKPVEFIKAALEEFRDMEIDPEQTMEFYIDAENALATATDQLAVALADAEQRAEQQQAMAEQQAQLKEQQEAFEKQRQDQQAEQKRIADEGKQREEEEKAELQVERDKQAEERRKLDAEKQEIADQKEKDEADRRAAEKTKQDKIEAEALEKAEAEAAEKKRFQEEADAKAEEERQEVLRPDKEKIKEFAENINTYALAHAGSLSFDTSDARDLISVFLEDIDVTCAMIAGRCENL